MLIPVNISDENQLDKYFQHFAHLGVWNDMTRCTIKSAVTIQSGHELYVNHVTSPTVMVLKPSQYTHKTFLAELLKMEYILACDEESLQKELEENEDLIQENQWIQFYTPFNVMNVLPSITTTRGLSIADFSYTDYSCLLVKKQALPTMCLDNEFTTGELEEKDAQQVAENWRDYPYPEQGLEYVTYMIKYFPTVAVRGLQGELVAWGLRHFWGAIGIIAVVKEHRKKGLGAYVMAEISKKLAEFDQLDNAFSHIHPENKPSFKLHNKCNFEILQDQVVQIIFIAK